jgi:MarR family transcriptional regulator, organic hydroperoxide resistance regulator
MSISKLQGRQRTGGIARKIRMSRSKRGSVGPGYLLPLTVSRPGLLENGSDLRFRGLVYDLLTIAARMEIVRGHLGQLMQVTGPQYSLLTAVATLQGDKGVSVGTVARMMHVSSAFVASESGKLVHRGLLLKKTNPQDRRGVLLSLSSDGRSTIDRLGDEIRAINDLFFGTIDARSFSALSAAAIALVAGSSKTMQYLAKFDDNPSELLGSAGLPPVPVASDANAQLIKRL